MAVVTKRIAEPQDDEAPSVLFSILSHEDDVSQTDVDRLVDELRRASLRLGIIVTPSVLMVVEQSGWNGSLRAYQPSVKLSTADLFAKAGVGAPIPARLEQQFFDWIRSIQRNWIQVLPPEAAPVMIPDVVASLLGSQFATLET